MAEVAGEMEEGIVSTAPSSELVETFSRTADDAANKYGQLTVCWDESEEQAKQIAMDWWPNTVLPGQLGQELASPALFEQACELVNEDEVAEKVVCGPDLDLHLNGIQEFIDEGFDHIYIHQVGPNQDGLFDAYEREILPSFD